MFPPQDPNMMPQAMQPEMPQGMPPQQQDPNIQINEQANLGMLTGGASFFEEQQRRPRIDDNLALYLNESTLSTIGGQLKQAIEDDYQSAQPWRNALANALKLLDTRPTKESWPFVGASGYTSDAFSKALLRTKNNIMAEVWPVQGCIKAHLLDESEETMKRSERVVEWFEYYFNEINPEFRVDKDQMCMWGALSGSVFSKVYFDPVLNRPQIRYVKAQKNLIVNQGTRSLETATRITHRFRLSNKEMLQYKATGIYRNTDIAPMQGDSDYGRIDKNLNRMMGETPSNNVSSQFDKEFEIDECHTYWNLPGFEHRDNLGKLTDIPLPYRITMEKESGKVLSIYANWEEGDAFFKPIDWFVHYGLLGGLDFYNFGLTHMCAGNAELASRMGRQIENAATLANFPAGFRSKSVRLENTEITLSPLSFMPIETMGGNINDNIMLLPFRDPSPALLGEKKEAEEAIQQMMGVIETQFSDMNPNSPVGTTLAMLEELHQTQAAYVRSYHSAFSKELKLLLRLFKKYLGNEIYPFPTEGGVFSIRDDLISSIQIIPVSNPNLATSAQRLIQNEGLLNLAKQNPDMYDVYEINKRLLIEMKVPQYDKILKSPPQPAPPLSTEPLSENSAFLEGKQVKVTLGQNHKAHKIIHGELKSEMQMRLNVNAQDAEATAILKAVEIHDNEHNYYEYAEHILANLAVEGQMVPPDIIQQIDQLPIELQNMIADMAAQSVLRAREEEDAQKGAQGQAPDPNATYAREMDIKEQEVQMMGQLKMMQLQLEEHKVQMEQERMELERLKVEFDREKNSRREDLDQAKLMHEIEKDSEVLADKRALDMVKVMKEKHELDLKETEKNFEAAKDMREMALSEEDIKKASLLQEKIER